MTRHATCPPHIGRDPSFRSIDLAGKTHRVVWGGLSNQLLLGARGRLGSETEQFLVGLLISFPRT